MSTGHVLVTGGAGYIGSMVCCALKKRGFTPIVLDNLSHGHRSLVQFGPLVEGDIGDAALIKNICKQYQPKAALHFAALIEVAESVKNPELFIHNNYEKARILFESLQTNHIDAIVFSSTAAVYGTPNHNNPLTERDNLAPINPYGVSKLMAETFLREQPQLRSVTLRYFNAAGADPDHHLGEAHWPESHLIPNALLALLHLKNEPFMLYGTDYPTSDGTALRDYIHVLDLAEAHVMALDYLLKGGGNLIINLGSGSGFTVQQVMHTIERVIGKAVPYQTAPRREGDPACLVANNSMALEHLRWQPKRGLEEIVRSAHAWHASSLYSDLIKPLQQEKISRIKK